MAPAMHLPDDRYEPISVDEAASRLKISPSTVRRMIRDGKLKAERETRPQGEIVRVLWPAATDVSPPTITPSEPSATAHAIDLPAALSAATEPLTEALALERTERQKLAQEIVGWAERAARAETRADMLAAENERLRRPWWRFW